jgi:hypothetical protein
MAGSKTKKGKTDRGKNRRSRRSPGDLPKKEEKKRPFPRKQSKHAKENRENACTEREEAGFRKK